MKKYFISLIATLFLMPHHTVADDCKSQKIAKEFLTSLLDKDEKEIIEYMGSSKIFLTDGKINEDIQYFLYEEKNDSDGWKSITEISRLDALSIKIIEQEKNVITVLFYPKKFEASLMNISFLQNEWMKKYFSCEFEVINNKWEFYQSFCFAETDGPFPSPEG